MTKLKVTFLLILFLHSSHFLFSQRADSKLMSIQEMFDLAEANSRSIRTYDLAEKEAEQAVQIAKNALLPSVDVSGRRVDSRPRLLQRSQCADASLRQ